MHHMDVDKAYREKAWRKFQKNAMSCDEQILEATFTSNSYTATHLSSLKPSK